MSKNLKLINVLYKIAKIVSKIVFICSIIGAVACLVGIIALSIGKEHIQIENINLILFNIKENTSISNAYACLIATFVSLVPEIVIAKYIEVYCNHTLSEKTPFTDSGANQILKIGGLIIIVFICNNIFIEIFYGIMSHYFTNIVKLDFFDGSGIIWGIMFIVLSVIYRYGAELEIKSKNKDESEKLD